MSETREKIIERKLKLSENPLSIVLAPRTKEGHVLAKVLFPFDKAVNQIRMKVGTYISIDTATEALRRADAVLSRMERFTESDGMFFSETPQMKRILAEKLTTYVFLPRTEEGKRAAAAVKRLDSWMVQFRTTCSDFSKAGKTLREFASLVGEFISLTDYLASKVQMEFKVPKGGEVFRRVQ